MRLTFPRFCFLAVTGLAFALDGRLAMIGKRYGIRGDELGAQWASTMPSQLPEWTAASQPSTQPIEEFERKILEKREVMLEKAVEFKAESKRLYIYSGVLGAMWVLAFYKMWNRRWPGDRA